MESRPKILMFIDWYLPGYRAGGPVRSCANLIDFLAPEFDFYIVTGSRDYQSDAPYEGVKQGEWNSGPSGEQVFYISPESIDATFLEGLYRERSYDCVYIHGFFSSVFSIKTHHFFRKKNIRLILAPRGMLKEGALSIKRFKKLMYLKWARVMGWYDKTIFHATDDQEVDDIAYWLGKKRRVLVAPNLPKRMARQPESIQKHPGKLRLLFAGRVAPEKNLDLALKILFTSGLQGIEFNVYGAVYDRTYFAKCVAMVDKYPGSIEVGFHEAVSPDELERLLSQHHVLFLPTKGENFGHAILEAFMMGRPVIISNRTPWRNLHQKGVGVDIDPDDIDSFQNAIGVFLSMNNDKYQHLSRSSRNEYEQFCNTDGLIASSKALFLPGE